MNKKEPKMTSDDFVSIPPTRTKCNVNDYVHFIPTPAAHAIYEEYYSRFGRPMVDFLVDKDGYAKLQLWEYMHIFGPFHYNGSNTQIAVNNVLWIEEMT